MIEYWKKRLSHPIRGLLYALRNDDAFQIELFGGAILLTVIHFVFGPLSANALLLLIFCWFLIMITELQNTAMETALDKLHPELHEQIGRSKDMASGAVVWAGVFGIVCLLFILFGNI